jgi:hypothetical protein
MLRQRARDFQDKSTVVNVGIVVDNNKMNLFLALFWLVCAVVLLAYELLVGGERFYIQLGNNRFPGVWLMLALTLYNAVRWWFYRSYRARQRAEEIYRSYRARQRAEEIARANERWERHPKDASPPQSPDPNLNFTDEPPP